MRYFLNLPERDFAAFARRFADGLNDVAPALNLNSELPDELEASVGEMENVLDECAAARARMKSLTQKKKRVIKEVKERLKRSTKQVRGNSETTEAQLRLLGLQPYDLTRTTAALPDTAPYLTTEIRKSRRHLVRVRDRREGSTARAKPRGSLGAEIWLRIGDAGVLNEVEYNYLGLATNGTFAFEHDAADIGKQAYYAARWVNRKGERGGWSDTATATIAI